MEGKAGPIIIRRPNVQTARLVQTQKRRARAARQRHHHLVRGEMGLQFCCGYLGHSIHHAMRALARATHRLGYEVAVRMYEQERGGWVATSLRHIVGQVRQPMCIVNWGPSDFDSAPKGSPVVSFDVPDSYHWAMGGFVDRYNAECDLFCAPTEGGLQSYQKSGLDIPGVVVPLGVDTAMYRPCARDYDLLSRVRWVGRPPDPDAFLFLVAGYLQPRKGVEIAVEAFMRELARDENVALVIKNVRHSWGKAAKTLANIQRASIGLLEQDISEHEFARLLGSVDCYVSAHRREGFGLIPLQAMACGTQVVAVNYDGPSTYVTTENAILVEPRGTVSSEEPEIGERDQWAVIDPGDMARAMRQACGEDETRAGHCRREAGEETARTYSWERSASILVAAIERHVGQVRRRAEVVLRKPTRCSLSVLVPCRNGQTDLDRLCKSLGSPVGDPQGHGPGGEVLVLDDASETPIVAPPCRWPVTVIRSRAWIGEGAGRDRLLREARGEYVFMTDADVELPEGWYKALWEKLPERTVRHPVMMLPDGRVWSAGGTYHVYGESCLPAWHHYMGERPTQAEVQALDRQELAYAPGAGWFARREELLRDWDWIGGYFPTIFADVDMAFWLRSQGWRFELCADVVLVHHHGSYTVSQTPTAEQEERFRQHARAFEGYWGDWIEDDLVRRGE